MFHNNLLETNFNLSTLKTALIIIYNQQQIHK